MTQFAIGDYVRIKLGRADAYLQPWRDRFKKGRVGVIIRGPSVNVHGFLVEFEHGKVKYPMHWQLVIDPRDLEHFSTPEGKAEP